MKQSKSEKSQKTNSFHIIYKNMRGVYFFMNNYEIMMNGIVRIGEYAPGFEAVTTMGDIKLSDYKGKWVVLFSHPRLVYPRMYN